MQVRTAVWNTTSVLCSPLLSSFIPPLVSWVSPIWKFPRWPTLIQASIQLTGDFSVASPILPQSWQPILLMSPGPMYSRPLRCHSLHSQCSYIPVCYKEHLTFNIELSPMKEYRRWKNWADLFQAPCQALIMTWTKHPKEKSASLTQV